MAWEKLASKDNKLIRHIAKLAADGRYRRSSGAYVCEGEKLLWEALRDGVKLEAVLWEEKDLRRAAEERPEQLAALESLGCRCASAAGNVFGAASFLETFSGPVFVCSMEERPLSAEGRCFLALENVQDPGNVGTVLRTADAFSLDGVFLLEGTADPWQPKAVRAAMGSVFRVPFFRTDTNDFFEEMKKRGISVCGAALSADAEDVRGVKMTDCAFVIGNEGRGLRPETAARCEKRVVIPMPGRAESLNAAVAAAILMWEMSVCRWNTGSGCHS